MNMKTDCVLVLLLSLVPKDTPDKQYPQWYSPPVKKEKYTEIKYMNVIIYKKYNLAVRCQQLRCILKPQYLNIKNPSYQN